VSETAAARARALLEVGRAPEAIGLLGQALSRSPGSCQLLCLLSEAHWQERNYGEAVRAAERAIGVNPEAPRAYYWASLALNPLRRHREAIELAREAVRLAPTEWWTHAGLATAFAHKHDRPFSRKFARRAMVEARRAVELAPDEPDAHFALGYCAGEVGRRREAKTAYERVLSVRPDDALALNNLSGVQLSSGRPITAVEGFRAVAADGRNAGLARHNIGTVGMALLGSAYLGLFVLHFVLRFVDESHLSRALYAQVDWGVLLLMAALAALAVWRLPRTVRVFYRELIFGDWLFGLRFLLIAVAAITLACSALPASEGLRSALREIALVCLLGSAGVAWGWRTQARRSLSRT
jgi:Flp pilus assembly protein TadD